VQVLRVSRLDDERSRPWLMRPKLTFGAVQRERELFFPLLSVLPEKRESRGKNEHQRKTSLALSHSLSLSGFPWGPSSSSQGGLVSSSSYNVMLLSLCIYTLYSLYMFYITYNFFSLYCYYLSTSKWGKSRNQSIFQFQSLYSLRFNPFQNIIILYLPL
jgi:hypothetical protein